MKTPGRIIHQAKQVRWRHLKNRLKAGLRAVPSNCAHNRQVQHPKLQAAGDGPTGVCVCPKQEGDVLCDIAWGGFERAKECPFFEARTTKEQIKVVFLAWLATAELHEIAAECPDLAALLWVLSDEAPDREVEINDHDNWNLEDDDTEEEYVVTLGDVTLRAESPEAAEQADLELTGMNLALTTATTQFKQAMTDLEAARTTLTTSLEAQSELELAKHELESELKDALRDLQAARDQVPAVVTRVSWWRRLLGGGL